MTNLVITLLSIALTAAMILATVSYMPPWTRTGDEQAALVRAGFDRFERAHYLASKAIWPSPEPAPTADADGGLAANFQAYYSFLPRPIPGFQWKYGKNDANGLHWFCLYSTAPAGEDAWYALNSTARYYSNERYFVHSGGAAQCGQTVSMARPSSFPAQFSATFYVRYVNGS